MSESKSAKVDWVKASKSEPCAVCSKPDYCTRSADGKVARCMRVESTKESNGGWIHKLSEPLPEVKPAQKKPTPVGSEEWSDRAEQCFTNKRAEAARSKLAQSLGVQVAALELLKVGCGWDEYRNLEYTTWPERTNQLKVCGIIRRYWQPVDDDGKTKLAMAGGKQGLYLCENWWLLGGPIMLVEGGSCTSALMSVGVCCIGRPSNTGGVNLLLGALQGFADRPLVVVGENDEKPDRRGRITKPNCSKECGGCGICWPGMSGARRTAEALSKSLNRAVFVGYPPDGAKDSRSFLNSFTGSNAGKYYVREVMKKARKV